MTHGNLSQTPAAYQPKVANVGCFTSIIAIMLAIVVFGIGIFVNFCSSIEENTPVRIAPHAPPQKDNHREVAENLLRAREDALIDAIIPYQQKAFIDAVAPFYKQYDDAPNELKKSAIRAKRAEAIKQALPTLDVNKWVGRITTLGTNHDGMAYVWIRPIGAEGVTIMSAKYINLRNPLYDKLSNMSEGTMVAFSGTFQKGDKDYISESSVTEIGSMVAPDFMMFFSDISIYQLPAATGTPRAADLPGFTLIPGGEFTMGDALDGDKDAPLHKVNVNVFYIQKKEVSKAQWDEVREWALKHGYTDLPTGQGKAEDHPVQTVSWYDVVKWCNGKSEKEGLIPCYYTNATQRDIYRTGKPELTNAMVKWDATGYRLPTEAEWEKAARGGLVGKRFPWGDAISYRDTNTHQYQADSVGYHPTYKIGEEPYTSPVGSFAANGYWLYDMAGNVSEWCWDRKGSYRLALETDPRNSSSGEERVLRGGSWFSGLSKCRVAARDSDNPTDACNESGFRMARAAISQIP